MYRASRARSAAIFMWLITSCRNEWRIEFAVISESSCSYFRVKSDRIDYS